MNILVLDCDYFGDLWRAAGHQVFTCGDAPGNTVRLGAYLVTIDDVLAALGPARAPDVIFWGDRSQGVRVLGLENCPVPKVMYSVDTHHHAAWHIPYSRAFDAVFVAQKDFLDDFRRQEIDAQWLPLFATPEDTEPVPENEKRHNLSFVGSLHPTYHGARRRFIEKMRAKIPMQVAEGPYVETFRRSRIVLNQTVSGDLNFRVFEALACGCLLLTERTGNGLLDLFADGVHLVTYEPGKVEDAAAKARFYLVNAQARERIARAGWQEVRHRHLRSHRARVLLQCFESLLALGPSRPSLDPYALTLNQGLLYFRLYERVVRIHAYWRSAASDLPGDRSQILQRTTAIAEAYLHLARRYVSLARELCCGDKTWQDLAAILPPTGPSLEASPVTPCPSGT